ncbi:trigger factor [Lujinxingia litoralis]|uniref:Trigger factor n=1 Tax=Lujinxingia litoralis TaxID=2211119 RepID=A0A328C3Y4_9DELT|nr:trigger factor [Lujinxingia litoralis]RAL21238.1 trigger factor [Lujinxingia litoralis]
MAHQVEETGELTRSATITVEAAEYDRQVNKALRKLSGRVKVPGFRKGKIPLSVMKQRYGQAVTRDVIEDLVTENVNKVLNETENVLHVGVPQVTDVPFGDGGELKFTVDFELRPEIDPIGYLGVKVEKPVVEIADEAIDAELEQLRQSKSTLEAVVTREAIELGDIVTVDFEAVGEHPELQDMRSSGVQIEIGSGQTLPGIEDALKGQAFDAVVDSEIEAQEDFPVEELRGEKLPIRLTVTKVERKVLPELDDDFAQTTGQGETLLELRATIRKRLEEQREKEAEQLAIDSMMKNLLGQNSFELPPSFLDEQVKAAAKQRLQMFAQQGIDPAQFGLSVDAIAESIREDVVEQIKREFLLMEIARKEELKVEEADLTAFFERRGAELGANAQQYRAFVSQNTDRMRQAQASALLEKVRAKLLADAELTEVAWPSDEEAAAEEAPAEEAKPKKKASTKKKSTKKDEEGEASAEEAKPKKKASTKKKSTKKKDDDKAEDAE